MANLTATNSLRHIGTVMAGMQIPIKAAAKIYGAAMVCALTANGYAVRAGTASTGCVLGVAKAEAAIPTNDGDVDVDLLTGLFVRPLDGTHPPVQADYGKLVYAKDDGTLSNLQSDGPIAGIFLGFEDASGDGIVFIHPLSAGLAELESLVHGLGASLIGIEDAGNFTATANVEAALQEIYQSLETATATRSIPIGFAILAAGTPLVAFADAEAATPGVTVTDSKAVGVRWNDHATPTAIFSSFVMPDDIDTSVNAEIDVIASKTGATIGDATTFDVALFKNAVGALHDADASFGGTTTAMVGNAATKTVQKVTLALLAANLGNPSEPVSVSIKPTNGTLGTDDVTIEAVLIKYKRKVKTA